jgi:hypothetical protein
VILKGHEKEMFAKLAQKYRVSNPLGETDTPNSRDSSSPVQTMPAWLGASGASTFSSPAPGAIQNSSSSFMNQMTPLNASPFGATSGQGSSQFPFGATTASSTPAPSFGTSVMSSHSPFGQQNSSGAPQSSPFGQPGNVVPSPSPFGVGKSSQLSPTPIAAGVTFGGKSPRDLLMAFYQQKNPSKIAEVDKLLAKYQVRIGCWVKSLFYDRTVPLTTLFLFPK